jgi:hypothetical protein
MSKAMIRMMTLALLAMVSMVTVSAQEVAVSISPDLEGGTVSVKEKL